MFAHSLFVSPAMKCFVLIITFVAMANGNDLARLAINDRKLSERDWTEFRVTKLFNVELGGQPDRLDTDLKKTILSAVKSSSDETTQPVRTEPSTAQENSNKEVAIALKEMYSEISELKKKLSTADRSTSDCFVQSDIVNGKSFPVGTSYHRLCPSRLLNEEFEEAKEYYPQSCKEIQKKGNNVSGIYQIQPKHSQNPFMVLCDMETKGGGWAHIQKRYDGSVDFFLDWREYKFGFGDLGGEFWLGLKNIYKLTGFEVNELLVEIVDRENKTAYAHYKAFGIGPEAEGYPLSVLRDFSGDAGDSLTYHLGSKFSTKDFDQDSSSGNCAVDASGAWWYKSCYESNLNGKYINAIVLQHYNSRGIHWHGLNKDYLYCHAKTRLMVRPVG